MSEDGIYVVLEQVRKRNGDPVQEQYPLRAFETGAAEQWRDQLETEWADKHIVFDNRQNRTVFRHTVTEALFRTSIQAVPMGPESDNV